MKKMYKMFMIVAVATVSLHAERTTTGFNMGKDIRCEMAINENSGQDGNFLHKTITSHGNKDVELEFILKIKPYALQEEIEQDIKEENFVEIFDQKYVEASQDCLKELLYATNKDGYTPQELLELKRSLMSEKDYHELKDFFGNLKGMIMTQEERKEYYNQVFGMLLFMHLMMNKQ
jgi:hypothetical protein